MDLSPTGLFELCRVSGVGLVDAVADDLLIMTTDQTQTILIGCGKDAISSIRIAQDQVTFNTPLNLNTLTLCNLDVGSSLSTSVIKSMSPSGMAIGSLAGALALTSSSGIQVASGGNVTFKIGAHERMRIGANGFVGVGTTIPACMLDVGGSIGINGVQIVSKDAAVGNVSSLSVVGRSALGGGLLTVDPATASVEVGSNVSTYLGGALRVGGTAHVLGSVQVAGTLVAGQNDLYIDAGTGNVGLGTALPREKLDVSGNVISDVGTLGPTFLVVPPTGYSDVAHLKQLILDASIEPGNPATGGALFYNSLLGCDASSDAAAWKKARFVLRGCLLAGLPYEANPYSTLVVQRWSRDNGCYMLACQPFHVPYRGSDKGYQYVITPWFAFNSDDEHYALLHTALDQFSPFRVCGVHLQVA